jgi:hypothetical protein
MMTEDGVCHPLDAPIFRDLAVTLGLRERIAASYDPTMAKYLDAKEGGASIPNQVTP